MKTRWPRFTPLRVALCLTVLALAVIAIPNLRAMAKRASLTREATERFNMIVDAETTYYNEHGKWWASNSMPPSYNLTAAWSDTEHFWYVKQVPAVPFNGILVWAVRKGQNGSKETLKRIEFRFEWDQPVQVNATKL